MTAHLLHIEIARFNRSCLKEGPACKLAKHQTILLSGGSEPGEQEFRWTQLSTPWFRDDQARARLVGCGARDQNRNAQVHSSHLFRLESAKLVDRERPLAACPFFGKRPYDCGCSGVP